MSQPAAPGAESSADRAVPSTREDVADALEKLSKNAAISSSVRPLLAELRHALVASGHSPAAADGWIDIDLVNTFVRPETFIYGLDRANWPDEFPHRRLLTLLEVLQSVFIFVPLVITWFCLQQAADAYHRMLADKATSAAAGAGNFLELWQTGFGGKLRGPLKFEWAALYTLGAIVFLIGITIVIAELRRRGDNWRDRRDRQREQTRDRRDVAACDLLAALTRAQLIFNRSRLATPTRFAAELSHAAGSLGALLAQAGETQRSTLEVAGRYDETVRELTGAVTGLSGATAVMRAAAANVQAAANVLDSSGRELRADVTAQVTGAASRLETATAAAERELARQLAAGQSTMEQLAGRLAATLAEVAERVEAATNGLAAAGDTYASAIRDSGADAALHIGQAYQEAVLASTAEMRGAVLAGTTAMRESAEAALTPLVTASEALTGTIQRAGNAGERRSELLRASVSEAAAAAARSESALHGHADVLREHAAALQAMAGRVADALGTAGTDAAARQEAVLDGHSGVLRQHARALQEMTARLAAELGTADTAARARQDALLHGQAQTLREHASALRKTADDLSVALRRATLAPPRRRRPQAGDGTRLAAGQAAAAEEAEETDAPGAAEDKGREVS